MKLSRFSWFCALFLAASSQYAPARAQIEFSQTPRLPNAPFLLAQNGEMAPRPAQSDSPTFSIERPRTSARRTPAPSPSEGRFNTTIALGFLTAYAYKNDNRTLTIASAAATYTAYEAWSRRRTRLRNDEDGPNQAYFRGETDEYEFRKGRGDTAAALALVSAIGIATNRKTLAAVGGAGALWGYSRYRQTRREKNRAQSRQQNANQ